MRSKFIFLSCVLLVCAALLILGAGKKPSFTANLIGGMEVPAVTTTATGHATFMLSKDGKSIEYRLRVNGIMDATMAHLHMGAAGESGDAVVGLYPTEKFKQKSGKFSGLLAEGSFSADKLIGPLAGKTLADLLDQIKAGKIYVNVHTTANPEGEIRGQVK